MIAEGGRAVINGVGTQCRETDHQLVPVEHREYEESAEYSPSSKKGTHVAGSTTGSTGSSGL